MKHDTQKPDEVLKRVRAELGGVRSCALMMAHTPVGEARHRYLKSLNEKLASIETLLAKLPQDPQAS